MRPLSLEVQGFTAFRDLQQVSFAELDLFVITGPTGAGKTSLLDAMIFALYGQVPRLGTKVGTTDLISLGQAEARVAFEFSVRERGRFRIARRLRARGGQQVTFERFDDESWRPVVDQGGVSVINPEIVSIVGLDFDSFCRAVVLPQGEFHQFLKGDAGERRKVLFSLLGVGYFQRMAEMARARMANLRTGIERTEQIIQEQYGETGEDTVAELRTAEETRITAMEGVTAALGAAEGYAAAAELAGRRAAALTPPLTELRTAAEELNGIERAHREVAELHALAGERLEEASAALAAARGSWERAETAAEQLQEEHGTIERLAELKAAARTYLALGGDEQRIGASLRTAQEGAESARAARAESDQQRQAAETALAAARQTAEATARSLDDTRRGLDRLRATVTQAGALAAELTESRAAAARAREQAAVANAAVGESRTLWRAADVALAEARRGAAVAEIAADLHAGEACPVCGVDLAGEVHVDADARNHVHAAAERAATLREALDQAQAAASGAAERAAGAQANTDRAGQRLDALLGQGGDLETVGNRVTELERTAGELEERAGAEQAAIASLAQREHEAREAAAQHAQRLAALEATAESARRELSEIRARGEEAGAVLADHFAGTVPFDAAAQVDEQYARLTEAQAAARAARGAVDAAVDTERGRRAESERAQQGLGQVALALARVHARAAAAAAAVAAAADTDADELSLPATPEAPHGDAGEAADALRSWIHHAGTEIAAARGEFVADAERAGQQACARAAALDLAADSAPAAVAALRDAERAATRAATEAAAAVARAAEQLASRRSLEQRIGEERRSVQVLQQLALDLRTDRFGEYIIEETLGELALRASEELMGISDGRYSLVAEQGDFGVIDHANADERRSVKTLSGGETFLASLALALALSRHIGELAGEGLGARLEAVFIDEGFGTLDPATLDEVIDALERLRDDELTIGVISHVPELADRIGVGIEVRKTDGSSRVVMTAAA